MPTDLVAQAELLITLAKKHGLSKLKAGPIEFEFLAQTTTVEEQTNIPVIGEQMPSDDVMLFHSADSPIQVVNERR